MKDQQIRAVLDEHWAASAAGDLEKEHDIYADNVFVDYPQSMERISGRQNIQAQRGHHPSKPSGFKVRRILGNGDLWITEYVTVYDGQHRDKVLQTFLQQQQILTDEPVQKFFYFSYLAK